MNSSISMCGIFQNDALQMIWGEIKLMLEKDTEAVGIAFDDPFSIRQSVWVSYVHSGHTMGQHQQHPKSLWPDMCLAMRLIGRLGFGQGWEHMVRLREGHGSTWMLYLCRDQDGSLTTLEQIFHRVDDVFTLLRDPLDEIQ